MSEENKEELETHPQHAAPTNPKKRRNIILGIIAAVVIIIALVVAFLPNILANQGKAQLESHWPDDLKTVKFDGTTYEYDPNIVTVCLIGNDRARHTPGEGYNGQADTVIVAAINTETGDVSCISIPRNTMVEGWSSFETDPSQRETVVEQLCLVYSHGESDAFSSENVCHSASIILDGVPIKNYFTVNELVVGALADAIGGVTLVPTVTIPSTTIVEGEEMVLGGPNMLDTEYKTIYGGSAMDYVIWRDKTEDESSVHRSERQMQFIQAFVSQALEEAKSDPTLIVDLYNVASEYSTTNMGVSEFSYLASILSDHTDLNLELFSLPGETRLNNIHDDVYWEEVYLDEDAVREIVLDVFYNPVS